MQLVASSGPFANLLKILNYEITNYQPGQRSLFGKGLAKSGQSDRTGPANQW